MFHKTCGSLCLRPLHCERDASRLHTNPLTGVMQALSRCMGVMVSSAVCLHCCSKMQRRTIQRTRMTATTAAPC